MPEPRPSSAANDTPSSPSPDALDASVRLARVRRHLFAAVEAPRIAQYHVLRSIGGGAMGLVFAAWDPSLDRVVAIKILRDPWSPRASEKLRAEAVALARLRHAGVVSVFEVGVHEGQCFLAMEHVEGDTGRAWMQRWRANEPRDLGKLLDVIEQIARALAAAHAAGLVHRDVKPENVMIDGDGRARLMDFGLARPDESRATTLDDHERASATSSRSPYGTPGYMAPEQLEGGEIGPAADQFALAAWMFEALYRRRIRPDRTLTATAAANDPIVVPLERGVPRALQRILRRALAVDPNERWPSVGAFADAIAATRTRPRRIGVLAGIGVLAVGITAGAALVARDDTMCRGAEDRLAGVWDTEVASRVQTAIAEGDSAFAAAIAPTTWPDLDRYRDQWIETHRGACEATQLRGELSSEAMDRRMVCLEDRRLHLAAWVDVVEQGDAAARVLAERGAAVLPAISACADDAALARSGDVVIDETIAEQLAAAAASQAAGDFTRSQSLAADALAGATTSGDGVAIARAQLAAGLAAEALSLSGEAHTTLVAAYERARSKSLAGVATEAAIALTRVSSLGLSRLDEGLWWSRIADVEGEDAATIDQTLRRHLAAVAALHAAGRTEDAVRRANVVHTVLATEHELEARAAAGARLQLASLWLEAGDAARGTALAERAAAELTASLGSHHPANAEARAALCAAARLRGDMTGALEHARAALELAELSVGRDHVALAPYLERIARGLSDVGDDPAATVVLDRLLALDEPRALDDLTHASAWGTRGQILSNSDPAQSLAAYQRAHAIARATLGERHRTTVRYQVGEGWALAEVGRTTEAEPLLNAALLVGGAVLGSNHPDVRMIHHILAMTYDALGRYDEGLVHHRRNAEVAAAAFGDDSNVAAIGQVNVCNALIRLGHYQEALAWCDRAAPVVAAEIGASAHLRADFHNGRAAALAETGRFAEALPDFERALVAWREAAGPQSYEVSMVLLNLGLITERVSGCAAALHYFEEAVAMRERLRGPGHASLALPKKGLERCRKAGG